MLGPLLFLIFINDICSTASPLQGSGGLRLYADDAKLFSTDQALLQQSINSLHSWTIEHQLSLAPEKCVILDISKKNCNHPESTFQLGSNILTHCHEVKDLGIYFSSNLSFDYHINHIYKQAAARSYQILKCTKTRNIWTLIKLFKTYVRPKVESNSPIWSPHGLKGQIDKIEKIQRRYTKIACNRCGIPFESYEDRLFKLNLLSLQHRRAYFDLVYLFKIVKGISDINFEDYFRYEYCDYNLRGSICRIRPLHNFKNCHWDNNFFHRSCKWWNKLPVSLTSITSINLFKLRLRTIDFGGLLNTVQ